MRVTGSRHEFVRIDHKPTELPQVRQPLATLQLPPVGSSEGMLRRRAAFPLTSVEDDPHIVPVIKLATQLLVPIQTAPGDNEDQHDGAMLLRHVTQNYYAVGSCLDIGQDVAAQPLGGEQVL
jgi:hypothetical protein